MYVKTGSFILSQDIGELYYNSNSFILSRRLYNFANPNPEDGGKISARLRTSSARVSTKNVALPGSPWVSLAFPGSPWLSLALPGSPWLSLALPGSPWLSLAFPGSHKTHYESSGFRAVFSQRSVNLGRTAPQALFFFTTIFGRVFGRRTLVYDKTRSFILSQDIG